MSTTIVNARIFDCEDLLDEQTLVIDGWQIVAIGGRLLSALMCSTLEAGHCSRD